MIADVNEPLALRYPKINEIPHLRIEPFKGLVPLKLKELWEFEVNKNYEGNFYIF